MRHATLCAALAVVGTFVAHAAESAADRPLARDELKVLMIGNSFSICLLEQFPQVAKSMGLKLDLCSMYIGGCSFERHWSNVEKSGDPSFRPYKVGRSVNGKRLPDAKGNIPQVLAAEKWDVVTIQQASHLSWRPDSYHPYADSLVGKIRELAPQAEIVVQETWSYTPWDVRLAQWKIDQGEMYAKLHSAYLGFARANGFRMIPTGTAVQLYRRELPVVYSENSFGGDPCGSAKFVRGEDGKWIPKGDVFHLNRGGHYLQALVWAASLYGADVAKCAYRPAFLDAARAEKMKSCAMAACRGGARPYEFDWANRTKDDRPVALPLVSADGWSAAATTPGASATLTTGVERVLFGDGVMHLGYRLPEKGGKVVLRLAESVPLAPGFDTVSVWLYGNHVNSKWAKHPAVPVFLDADFLDSAGKPFTLTVHRFNHAEWFLAQKRLPPALAARVKDGGRFVGFTLRGGPDEHERWIELTSFAAFREELKPLSFKPRRKRGVQVFKNAPQGLNTGEGRLPFPNVETTIIPIVAEDPDIEFRLPKDPANWDDLAVRHKGDWMCFAKGGGLFPASAAKGAKVRFHRVANSLVADIEAPAGVEEVRFGNLAEPKGAKFFPLPYYTCGANGDGLYRRPCVVATETGAGTLFHLASIDWTQSNASWPFPPDAKDEPPAGSNGGVRYLAKTDGERNPVFERFVWSFSTDFDDVLPVIPNPPSPYRAVTAGRAWSVMFANNREKDKAYWRKRHRRGIRFLCVNDHENCFRDGNESFTFRTRPAPKKGGDEGLRDFTRFMTEELGYLYGPYNNYTDFAPVNGWWSADRVSRRQDGNLQPAWNRCYAPKPAFINEACEVIWTELQRKFRFNTAYCDVHTCATPWSRTDYDARVPGAGTFAATFYSFGELLDFERRVLGGPVYSEGQCHYMYCGLVDGNYAQDQKAKLPESPWLVDFDLLRMHPLANNFGMGHPNMFYAAGVWRPELQQDRVDRFLAATAAFGHQAFLVKDDEEAEERSYFMVLGVARHWCTADAKEIRYLDREGRLLRTGEAVVSGAHRRSQVAVTYTDGTVVFANGSTNEEMVVSHGGERVALNPNGFFALAGDGSARSVLNAKGDGGGRLDVAVAPDYAYVNAYGRLADTPAGATDGRMYRLKERDGAEEVFLRKGTTFVLPYAAESVVALDDDGRECGPAAFAVESGRTRLSPQKGALSFRVRKAEKK